jgi:hypothetical protein
MAEGNAMSSIHLRFTVVELGLRWTAKLLAAVLVGLVLVIFVGVGFNPLKLKGVEPIQMAFFWTACIGMVAAWRWPVIGGAVSLGGMIAFLSVEFAATGGLPRGLFFYLMLLPGILFLLSGVIRQAHVGKNLRNAPRQVVKQNK